MNRFATFLLCALAFTGSVSAQQNLSLRPSQRPAGRPLTSRIIPASRPNLNVANIASHRRNRAEALEIAKERAAAKGITMVSRPRRVAGQAADEDSIASYYVFNNGNDKGWTIVSGSDQLDQILGYSDEGALDTDNLPEQLKDMLNCYSNYADSIDSQTSTTSGAKKVMRKASTTTSPIGPLCVTKWDQYEPYSNNCPTVSSGKHAATCCVATAFAQILYYLYYTHGKQESTTFTTAIPTPTNTVGYVGSAVAASDRTYEWSKMLPDYAGKDYTDEQAAAIAKLMADIGSSFNVKYGTTSSYSTTDDYMSSLTSSSYPSSVGPTYWGIAQPSDLSYNGSVSSVSTWKTAINGELDKYYPVQIGGNGHAFVCDGRDANDMYHMNFGYDGRGNGFYSFDAINGYGTSMRITYGMRVESTYPTEGLDKLQVVYDAAVAYAANEPVGEVPGYYRQDYYDALQTLLTEAKTALDNKGSGMTDDELVALGEEISTAQQNMLDYRYPYPTGTYYLKSYDDHSGTDVVMYASGTSAKYGALSTSDNNYKWQLTYNEESNGYQIKNVGTSTYINSSSSSAVTLGSSSTIYTEVTPVNRIEETNSRFTNSYWDVNYATTLRPITSSMASSPTFIVISYSDGTSGSTSGTLIGWHPYNDWDVWIPVPIDVDYSTLEKPTCTFASSTLSIEPGSTGSNQLTTNSLGAVTYTSSNTAVVTVDDNGTVTAVAAGSATITAKIAKTDTYSSASASYTVKVESASLRAQLDALIAQGESLYTSTELATAKAAVTTTVSSTGLIQSSSQLSTPYSASGSDISTIIDGSGSTYWHSAWESGSVSTGTHYFEVTLTDDQLASGVAGDYVARYTRRSDSDAYDDFVSELTVYGTNDASVTDKSSMTELATISLPFSSSSTSVTDTVSLASDYKYLFFYITNTYMQSSGYSSRGYGHIAEFNMYEIVKGGASDEQLAMIDLDDAITTAKTVTYATQDAVDALQEAINNYRGTAGPVDPVSSFASSSISVVIGSVATNVLTTNSDGSKMYSSSNTSVATVNATTGEVTAVAEGTAEITVSLAATDKYNAATIKYTVTVTKTIPTITLANESVTLTIGESATNVATSTSTGTITYSSSNASVATVDASGKVTAVGAGTGTITVSVAATSAYAATTMTYTVTVNKKDQSVSFADASVSIMVDKTVTNEATSNGDGVVTYSSSNEDVAAVDSETGEVTGKGVGTAIITASAAATSTYKEASTTYTVTVTKNTEYDDAMAELLDIQQYLYTSEKLDSAKNAGTTTRTVSSGLITASSQFSSPYTESSEGSFANLLDKDQSTFWHSAWSSGSVSAGTHYFVVELNEAEQDSILLSMGRRSNATDDHVTQFEVYGSNDNSTWTDITTLDFAFASQTETVTDSFALGASYKYLKFVCTNTGSTSSSFSCRGYFHMGEFQLYSIINTTTPADENAESLITLDAAFTSAENTYNAGSVTRSSVDDLRAAIEAYTETGDVNLDGKVDVADVTWLIHYLKGNTNIKHGITDVNADYKTDVNDIQKAQSGLRDRVLNK